jgi:hypothetical protein
MTYTKRPHSKIRKFKRKKEKETVWSREEIERAS